ncbi:Zn(2)-C6 fungal-type domain-containing protein [Fusarium sp. Ph1]|nr:Zn(2)-C6 fungal-type domain-containing protein [Fusarium sp. Ph1]
MGRRSKQTSCFACVETKRRCDKKLPSCSRCLDRDMVCTYPRVPPRRQGPQSDPAHIETTPDVGFSGVWAPIDFDGDEDSSSQVGLVPDSALLDSALAASLFCPSFNLLPTPSSSAMVDPPVSVQLTRRFGDLDWFLQPQAWTVAFHYQPTDAIPPASVFSNFIRGLQDWLSRFVRNGHNPFIHRHLYSESGYPQCIQDAYSAIAISNAATAENENIVGAISSTHISNLLNSDSASSSISFNTLSARDHLARTQALLIHILLALFSSSIQRRARAESLMSTLHAWNTQLWESINQDTTFAPLLQNITPAYGGTHIGEVDPVPALYRVFVLSSPSVEPGYFAISPQVSTTVSEANSPRARWEAVARHTDPLFIYSLHGPSLLERGVGAAQVDEFARHLFTVMWGMEKVESWVVRTGDEVSVVY